MSTQATTTITLGDEPPTVHTYPISASGPLASIELGGGAGIIVRTEEQAYGLIEALGEAMAFFQDAEPAKASA